MKEPKRKTVDDFIEEEGLGAVEEEDLSDEVLEKIQQNQKMRKKI